MDTIELTTTATGAGLPDVVSGIAAAVGAKDWLALSGWIVGALIFIADWTDVLRFFSGVGRTVAVAFIATAIAYAAAAVLPGTTLVAVLGAADPPIVIASTPRPTRSSSAIWPRSRALWRRARP